MTNTYDNTNRGTLFKNKNRKTEKSAEYTGSLNVEGKEYFLDAWVKEKKDGSGKFFSVSVKAKTQTQNTSSRSLSDSLDDNIPF